MKIVHTHRSLAVPQSHIGDASALIGIVAGIGLLLPGFMLAEAAALLVAGFLVLVPSLLYGMR